MAKTTNRSFLEGDLTPETIRREFIQKPMANAKISLIGTGLELLDLMKMLPDAFVASQRRELDRLKAAGEEKDERIRNLEASIEQATTLRTTIQRGESRIERALGSLGDSEIAFHGFVSDADLKPMPGLTVRLSGREGASRKGLTAVTEEDGYFRISLGSKGDTGKEWRTRVGQINFAEKINIITEQPTAGGSSSSEATKPRGQVEILQGEKSVYIDPAGLPIDEGSVYREYVVQSAARPRSASDDLAEAKAKDVDVAQSAPAKSAKKRRKIKLR
ncbi:MAG TPA: carboxypeptidase-like regulatory domain-containing protein [Pyrinomonadaceae bacterium]